ncbi:hypothetical protein [Microbacterium invictum]|uniref:Uncharacterized protein n=1 Tax=Microbacterium invictum TaxID=515415 RepID=A0AA40VLJ4_9MICO|nr:hypothetical protein [Microbacterium invictum]MBB4139441.1 hypothetical protein [Microbacterium invictum]
MSLEIITTVISAAALLLTMIGMFIGGFAWVIRRVDVRIGRGEDRLGERIDGLGERIGGVERELVEVKIGIARIEGPPRRLMPAR